MDLSIIIVNYNGAPFIQGCLDSVFGSHTHYGYEVIIVDNASRDGSVPILRACGHPITLIENATNVGFSAANNQGVAQSTGRYIFLLNNDTVVESDTIQCLLDYFTGHSDVGIVAPQLLNRDGSLQGHGSGLMKWRYSGKKAIEVSFVTGAAMMVSREVYLRVGGLDENYFFYNEDLDFCKMIQKLGYSIIYLPSARLTHFGGLSTATRKRESIVEGYRGGLYFCKKHYGSSVYILYRFILFFDLIPRYLMNRIFGRDQSALAYLDIMKLTILGEVGRRV